MKILLKQIQHCNTDAPQNLDLKKIHENFRKTKMTQFDITRHISLIVIKNEIQSLKLKTSSSMEIS